MSRQQSRRRQRRPRDRQASPQGFAMRPGGLSRPVQIILGLVTILLALAFALGTPGLVSLVAVDGT